jgi:hypothetical protein
MEINVGVNRAYVESLLVGVALPAGKQELIDYAERQPRGAAVAVRLASIPDREYRALQDVGEELEPRQVEQGGMPSRLPQEESDLPPGGSAYVGESVEPANVVAARDA